MWLALRTALIRVSVIVFSVAESDWILTCTFPLPGPTGRLHFPANHAVNNHMTSSGQRNVCQSDVLYHFQHHHEFTCILLLTFSSPGKH